MEDVQAVASDLIYSLPVTDPVRAGQEAMIVVKCTADTIVYHSRLARYLALQCDRLIPHFYQQWEGVTPKTLQPMLLRVKQSVKGPEEILFQNLMSQSLRGWIASARLRQINVTGTLVSAVFAIDGIAEPLYTTDLMIPFNNLQVAQDIENTACDPELVQAA